MASIPYHIPSVDFQDNTHVLQHSQQKKDQDDDYVQKLHRAVTHAYRIASHVCLAFRNFKQLIDVIARRTDAEGGTDENSFAVDLERGHVRHVN
ncbi:hypothetical protein V8C44DRAFT_124376 [Trichoderma aethiopicum]